MYSQFTYGDIHTNQALQIYYNLISKRWPKFFWSFIRGCSYHLRSLDDVTGAQSVQGSHYEGTRTIDIRQIVGSENRSSDFDREFTPLKAESRDRWISIARAFLQGQALPPVEVIQFDNEYYVRDGHHRISVAKTLGQQFIDAEIISMQRKAII
jgi:hypothetical protein